MGIDPNTLKLRIVSTDIEMDPVKTFEHLTYEVFHDGTGAIVSGNKLAEFVEGDPWQLSHSFIEESGRKGVKGANGHR